MTTVRNLSELEVILHKQIIEILNKVGNEVKGVLKNELKKRWYNNFEPQQYERTFQLLNSISLSPLKVTSNIYEVKVYYDTSKIVPMDGTAENPWSRHQSIVTGAPSNEMLPEWIENGQHSSIFSFIGVHPVEGTYEWLKDDNYILNRFKELLRDRGFKVI